MDNSGSEILLNPGPVNLSQKVREALSGQGCLSSGVRICKTCAIYQQKIG